MNLKKMAFLFGATSALYANTSGKITTPLGIGVQGIQLQLHSNGSQATTDASGDYELYFEDITAQQFNRIPLSKIQIQQHTLTYFVESPTTVHWQLFDLRGKLFLEQKIDIFQKGTQQLTLPQVAKSGKYFLKLQTANQTQIYSVNTFTDTQTKISPIRLGEAIPNSDSLTLSFEGTPFATLPFDPTLNQQNPLSIARTLARGFIRSNASAQTNSSLLFTSSTNDSITLTPPTIGAGQEDYFFLYTPWRIYQPNRTWQTLLQSQSGNQILEVGHSAVNDSTEILDFYQVIPEVSSSSTPLSSGEISSSDLPSSSSFISSSEPSSSSISSSTVPSSSSQLRITEMPTSVAPFVNWVWDYRQASGKQDQVEDYQNLIFYPIVENGGYLNYCVRWQSNTALDQNQRDGIAAMLKRQINAWAKHLIGFENWPFSEIEVNVVGWAVTDPNLIVNPRSDEVVYSNDIENDVTFPNLPLPRCPDACARPLQYWNPNYSQCPGYSSNNDTHFDLSLWGTTGFLGGAGGDWGQRVSDDNIISSINTDFPHIIGHETGHGFGLPDYYEPFQIPDANYTPMNGIDRNYQGEWSIVPPMVMRAGASATITEADIWSFRKTWYHIKGNMGY